MLEPLQLLQLLLSSIDGKTLNLIRYLEYQIQFLESRVPDRLLPTQPEKNTFAHYAEILGRKELADRVNLFHPETLFRWHREMCAAKFNGAEKRGPGRRPRWSHIIPLLTQLRHENPQWGVQALTGRLHALGYTLDSETVRRLLLKEGLSPGPDSSNQWSRFIAQHQSAMLATDFLAVEVGTGNFIRTLHVLFFIQLDTRKVHIGGITENPNEQWMAQMARNLTMDGEIFAKGRKIVIMDRDTKYCRQFREILRESKLRSLRIPWRSPNLNAFAERWVRTVKEECLGNYIFFDEAMLARVLKQYLKHYNHERPHQGKGNKLLFPLLSEATRHPGPNQKLQSKSRLGGLLNFYYWGKEIEEKAAA